MGSRTPARARRGSSQRSASSPRLVWASLAVLLLVLLRCSPCQGRKLLAEEQGGGMVMRFGVGLVLRVPPIPGGDVREKEAAAAPRGFSRGARSMRSVPSPAAGH